MLHPEFIPGPERGEPKPAGEGRYLERSPIPAQQLVLADKIGRRSQRGAAPDHAQRARGFRQFGQEGMEFKFTERFFAKKPEVTAEAGPKDAITAGHKERQGVLTRFGMGFPSL